MHCVSVINRNIFRRIVNPFLANVPILYPLKTPENLWFSGVFKGYKMGTLARYGLSCLDLYSSLLTPFALKQS